MTRSIRLRHPRLLVLFGLVPLCLLLLGLKTMLPPSPTPEVVAADADVHALVAANTDFGFRLLTQLNQETPDKNIFFSPFSVSDALAMTLNGAGGTTQTDIAATLSMKAMTQDQINHGNGLLLPSLENPDPQVKLSVANALWADTDTTFNPEFQTRCSRFYLARTDTQDFHSPAAADTINGWVKDHTQGKIDRLVSTADLKDSAAVLTNAVYFHGQWNHKFDPSGTHDGPFTLGSGETKTVPLMSQERTYSYLETPEFQAISLPYGTGRMSMYVILPKPEHSLEEFVSELNGTTWAGWIGKMQPTEVTIFLPRFKAEYRSSLKASLSTLGMTSAFGSDADFKPMGLSDGFNGSDGFIGDVIHKAKLEVDEQGTVAAAATGVLMGQTMGVLPPQIIMRVDHPFFCAIRDNTTGTLLFAGLIKDPQ